MTIHNPSGVVLSKKDVEQGWRICFVEELIVARPLDSKYKTKDAQIWSDTLAPGSPIADLGMCIYTYITKSPMPKNITAIPVSPPPTTSDDPLAVLAKMLGTS